MTGNNYSIVQTIENDDILLSVLPSLWVKKNGWKTEAMGRCYDLCYWPQGVSGYRLLEKAKKDPKIPVDTKVLSAYRCKIKRNNFASFNKAVREQKRMESYSDTDESEPRKKIGKSTAAELFKQIESQPGPSTSQSSNFGDRQEDNEKEVSADESYLNIFPKREVYAEPLKEISTSSHSQQGGANFHGTDSTINEPNLHQLVLSLHNKTDENAKQIQSIKQSQNRYAALLSQMNAKLDIIATQKTRQEVPVQPESFDTKANPLTPIKSLADMESLEKRSDNGSFIQSVVQHIGSIHGKQRFVGDGATVCLQIIDYFFDREFLLSCSWSGISRNKKANENIISKTPFHKYDGIITLFHKVVLFSDPLFSKVQCEQFLHRCLRNAKQRFEEIKGTRASVARRRCKQSERHRVQHVEEVNEEVLVEEYLMDSESLQHASLNYQTDQAKSIDEAGVIDEYMFDDV
ncbi:LOW QUALITY PROTEIN: uncharacterized protein LOC134215314 [Armigeres subalbatus]|uniref:LOW QUALITY PROTEIN: uncharacterized protein LOC134215314 n=1 Tax=Armigeres subalbatus TaxID=124917 RepID=UPI002ED6BA4F